MRTIFVKSVKTFDLLFTRKITRDIHLCLLFNEIMQVFFVVKLKLKGAVNFNFLKNHVVVV